MFDFIFFATPLMPASDELLSLGVRTYCVTDDCSQGSLLLCDRDVMSCDMLTLRVKVLDSNVVATVATKFEGFMLCRAVLGD